MCQQWPGLGKVPFPFRSVNRVCCETTESKRTCIPTDINDLQTVLEALVDVNQQWKRLGLALGLRQPTLEGISGRDSEECKEKMLTKWLSKVDECSPSWNVLVAALRKRTVGHRDIADAIAGAYL